MKVKMRLDGDIVECLLDGDEFILTQILDQGYEPPYSCEVGSCGACRAKLIEGSVEMDEDEGLSIEEKEESFILTCQARAKSDIFIDYDANESNESS